MGNKKNPLSQRSNLFDDGGLINNIDETGQT
jgi:hypothetical protein